MSGSTKENYIIPIKNSEHCDISRLYIGIY